MPIDFQEEAEATPAAIDFAPAIDFQEEESAQDTSQMTPEARESLARAERTADLMMERKRLGRMTRLEEPIAGLGLVGEGVASPIQSAGMVVNTAGNLAKAAALDAGV